LRPTTHPRERSDVICAVCGLENEAGRKFCGECGSPLAAVCPACGTANSPGMKFCGECGSPLGDVAAAVRAGASISDAERRLVTVLFADLVGFTALSESRDPEEVRELLGSYFETCRRLIDRYGGTVEKFIGDAVMAVWGTPTAQEDDAERAVRAALELVEAVAAMGEGIGSPDLQARAGVLTGEAAVNLSAAGQGMVAGDMVNTASRIQSAAEPGTVLAGDATRRATEAAIIYEDAGEHLLKGKADIVQLHRAVRVIGGRGGALRSTGLEAPFVGRDRELRLLKELFHASAEDGSAHLLSVIGVAGIGKSRLSWEFYKYIDGLAQTVYWHRGRCLAYGEGVTYWALAEMLRGRAGIAEGEGQPDALAKLRASLDEHVHDPEERRWLEPRLAQLLGLEDRTAAEREDLFAAARLFFERLTDRYPSVLVFEDMQWAEPALVEFIGYLLDWSRGHPLFVLALARPEVTERHPGWGAGQRNATSLYLEPLPPSAMDSLLTGLAPGLQPELRGRILDRAEGVPLYAVETVRMLIDRGVLVRDGNGYRLSDEAPADLDVPETLHALIAARLDGLEPRERRFLQDASVLGKTFTRRAAAAISGMSDDEVEPILSGLVRKEVLSLQADPRSPERGQYGFLQDLVRRVAYETMPKRERKARHLAAADDLEHGEDYEESDVVEVVAAHLLDAHALAPDAEDAPAILERARAALTMAGRRAASLAANDEARRHFERAAELTEDPIGRGHLLEQAGEVAWRAGKSHESLPLYDRAIELYTQSGAIQDAARASARTGLSLWTIGQLEEALRRMQESETVLGAQDQPGDPGALAEILAELARLLFFRGDLAPAMDRVNRALELAEAIPSHDVISQALNTKSLILSAEGRIEEALALLHHALRVALDNELAAAAVRAYINLSHMTHELTRLDEALDIQTRALAHARRVGIRWAEWWMLGHLTHTHMELGDWDAVEREAAEIPDPEDLPDAQITASDAARALIDIALARGDVARAEHLLARHWPPRPEETDVQVFTFSASARARVALGAGRFREALEIAEEGLGPVDKLGLNHPAGRICWISAMEAALAQGDLAEADRVFEIAASRPAGHVYPYLRANMRRFRAALAAARDDPGTAEAEFRASAGAFRDLKCVVDRAVVQTEHLEWLDREGRAGDDEALRLEAEARAVFEPLGAAAWLERLDRVVAGAAQPIG
jgi:class 3 adenylate cyclase/predicted ATPase